MKIYGKQVLIGSKKICMEYTTKIIGGFDDCQIGHYDYKDTTLEKDIIFIKDKQGYLIDIRDIDGSGFLALNIFGSVSRYKTEPHHAGDLFVSNLKPYMSEIDQETVFDLKTLLQSLKKENSSKVEL